MPGWIDTPLLRRIDDTRLAYRLDDMIAFWTDERPVLWGLDKCPDMAPHGCQHAQSVFEVLSDLLSAHRSVLEKLNNGEIFCLVCVSWLHDIGMKGDERTKIGEEVRKIHGRLTYERLKKDWNRLQFRSQDEALRVGEICIYHQSKAPLNESQLAELGDKSIISRPISKQSSLSLRIDQGDVEYSLRMRFLAALLSLADACDTQRRRMISDLYADHRIEGIMLDIHDLQQQLEVAETESERQRIMSRMSYLEQQRDDHYLKHLSVKRVYFSETEIILEPVNMIEEHDVKLEMALSDIRKELERSGPTLKEYGIDVRKVRAIRPDETMDQLQVYSQIPAPEFRGPEFDDFVGRENILEDLAQKFTLHPIAIVAEISGMGKTYVGSKYCVIAERNQNRKAFWHEITPQAGEAERIIERLAEFVQATSDGDILHTVQSGMDSGRSIEWALNLLVQKMEDGDYILCFDDVHKGEADETLSTFFDKLADKVDRTHILLLSQNVPVFYRKSKNKDKFYIPDLPGFEQRDLTAFVTYLKAEFSISDRDAQALLDNLSQISKNVAGHPQCICHARNLFQAGADIGAILSELPDGAEEASSYILQIVYDGLTDEEKVLLSFLSVFERDFGSKASQFVPDVRSPGIVLFKLRDRTLVKRAGSDAYRIHSSVKTFVKGKLSRDELPDMHRRCAEYLLSREHRNLDDTMEAEYHLRESGDIKRAYQLIKESYKELVKYGRLPQLTEKLEKCSKAFRDQKDVEGELEANFRLGTLYSQHRMRQQAIGCFERNIHLRSEAADLGKPDQEGQLAAEYMELGHLYDRLEMRSEAEAKLSEGIRLAEKVGEPINLSRAYYYMGRFLRGVPEGIEFLRKALYMLSDKTTELAGEIYNALGENYSRLNQWQEAVNCYEKAADIFRDSGNWYQLGGVYSGRARMYHRLWDFHLAAENYMLNIDLMEQGLLPDLALLSQNMNLLAEIYRLQGNASQAADLLERSLQVAESIDDDRKTASVAYAMICLANVLMDRGEMEEAVQRCAKAGTLLGEARPRPYMERILLRLHRLQKDWRAAEKAAEQVLAVSDEEEDYEKAQDLLELGLLAKDIGNDHQARKCFNEAYKQVQGTGNKLLAEKIMRETQYM